jgi:hypothetical protein
MDEEIANSEAQPQPKQSISEGPSGPRDPKTDPVAVHDEFLRFQLDLEFLQMLSIPEYQKCKPHAPH